MYILFTSQYIVTSKKTAYQPSVSTLFETFFFLKAYQNPCQAQRNNTEFTQLRRHDHLLTSIHRALKVTADVLSPILY